MHFKTLEDIYNYCKYCKLCEKDVNISINASINVKKNFSYVKNNSIYNSNNIEILNLNNENFSNQIGLYFRSGCNECDSYREMLNFHELRTFNMYHELYNYRNYELIYKDLCGANYKYLYIKNKLNKSADFTKFPIDIFQKCKSIDKFLSRIENLLVFA